MDDQQRLRRRFEGAERLARRGPAPPHSIAVPPNEESYTPHEWQKPHVENMTGTADAYRPKGSQLSWGQRPAATGDYVPWTPGD